MSFGTFKTPARGQRRATFVDMSGVRVGRLVVLYEVPATHATRWLCRCECGGTCVRTGADLRAALKRGNRSSCGKCGRAREVSA